MRSRSSRITIAVISLPIAAMLLSACSQESSEVEVPAGFATASGTADSNGQSGSGGTSPTPNNSPSIPVSDLPTTAPTGVATAGPSVQAGEPSLSPTLGQGMGATGTAGLNLPNALDPSQVPVPTAAVDGFTGEDLKSAHLWAAAFAKLRYANSGFWQDAKHAAPLLPPSYYFYTTFMSPDKAKEMESVLLGNDSVAANQELLDQLAPRPPKDANWMIPGVSDFVFGEAEFAPGEPTSSGDSTVQVAFPMVAYAAYDVNGKEFYAVPVEERITLTLVKGTADQPWLIQDWNATTTYGEAKKLDGQPSGRQVAKYAGLGGLESAEPIDPSTLSPDQLNPDGKGGSNRPGDQ